jgi:hypothetical protein
MMAAMMAARHGMIAPVADESLRSNDAIFLRHRSGVGVLVHPRDFKRFLEILTRPAGTPAVMRAPSAENPIASAAMNEVRRRFVMMMSAPGRLSGKVE